MSAAIVSFGVFHKTADADPLAPVSSSGFRRADLGLPQAEVVAFEPSSTRPTDTAPRLEVWLGGEAANARGSIKYWSIWSGITWAPFTSIYEPGLRLRLASGGGQYTYDGARRVDGGTAPTRFQGSNAFDELLIGYQAKFGGWTVKPFVGAAGNVHFVTPDDPFNPLLGKHFGAKIGLENWFELSPTLWSSLDASWTSVHSGFWSKGRIGVRLHDLDAPGFSLGPEVSAYGDSADDAVFEPRTITLQGGGFLRYEWERGEIIASGGIIGAKPSSVSPYASGNLMIRF